MKGGNSLIYILCPEKFATGGTELLHQLYAEIREYTPNVRIFYYNFSNTGTPINKRFERYNIEYVTGISDEKTNFLIIPETRTQLLKDYRNVGKAIYWLSVDHYTNFFKISKLEFSTLIMHVKYLLKRKNKSKRVDFSDKNIIHLYQSHYAKLFLEDNGATSLYSLSDPISDKFLKISSNLTDKSRGDIVLYNPLKGYDFTQKIIKSDEKISFVPLKLGLSQDELIDLFTTSKVYIDFGYHPGKDRFPREAAHLGCAVITSKRGSAKYYQDVPIPSEYKIDDLEENISKIRGQILRILDNYNESVSDFDEYRKKIMNEKVVFKKDVERFWTEVLESYNKYSFDSGLL